MINIARPHKLVQKCRKMLKLENCRQEYKPYLWLIVQTTGLVDGISQGGKMIKCGDGLQGLFTVRKRNYRP